ncbi:MAG: hypothetical protein IJ429_05085 [Lachnospiraceae bacterium]|nr:hypothetical protein [Lachnospiraceae bacterium]
MNLNLNADVQKIGTGISVSTDNARANTSENPKSFSLAHKVQDPVAERKAQAFEKARKIVSDAFAGEQKIDKEMQELRDLSARLVKENKEKLDQTSQNKTEMDDLKQIYGISDESREQKDLEILMKKNDSYYDPSVRLTEEEQKRYQEIMTAGKTEYQSRMMERYEENNRLQSEMQENLMAIHANGSALRFIKGERLKTNPIGEAEDAARKVLDAESDVITGMLVGDAIDHMQEELSEKVEEAEKQAEQTAEKEEQIEKVQEKVEEQKQQAEELREETKEATRPMNPEDIVQIQEQIQAEIDKVLEELKLLAEDLKGNAVDKLI